MKSEQRKYTREFKESAVALATRGDRTSREVAKDLGIPLRTLYGWLRGEGYRASAPDSELGVSEKDKDEQIRELRARISKLEREKDSLREEREILKKATAFFARENL